MYKYIYIYICYKLKNITRMILLLVVKIYEVYVKHVQMCLYSAPFLQISFCTIVRAGN